MSPVALISVTCCLILPVCVAWGAEDRMHMDGRSSRWWSLCLLGTTCEAKESEKIEQEW